MVLAIIIPVWILHHKSVSSCKDTTSGSSFIPVFTVIFFTAGQCLFHQLAQRLTLWLLVSALKYLRAKSFDFSRSYTMSLLEIELCPSCLKQGQVLCRQLDVQSPFAWVRASLLLFPHSQVSLLLAVLQKAEECLQLRHEFGVSYPPFRKRKVIGKWQCHC